MRLGVLGLIVWLAVSFPAGATQTERWILDTASDLAGGRGNGVALTLDGRLVPASPWRPVAVLEEPVVLAAVRLPDGTLVAGTGNPARLVRISGDRREVLAEVPSQQVTALLALPDGGLLVASVGPAVLYRFASGTLEEVGRLGEGGIWDLARFGDTAVVAAGPPATLYRVTSRGLERWVELPDVHARCLAVRDGSLVVGTSGKGYVMRVDADGRVGVVADTPFTEIADVVAAPDGVIWAAAVVGEPGEPQKPKASSRKGGAKRNGATVTASVGDLKLPKVNGKTASSELLRVTPDGVVLSMRRFADQVVSALAWDGSGVLAGTGWEGEIWRFEGAWGTRLAVVDAVQVVAFADGGRVALTQGPASVLLRGEGSRRGGTFRSPVKRFKIPARFGRYRVLPDMAGVRIRFRSGLTADPDASWLPWTGWLPAAGGVVPLEAAPSLQWELEIPGEAADGVDLVEVSWQTVNAPPVLKSITVEEPGAVWLASPPPSGQFVQVEHPDQRGIFTVLGTKTGKAASTKRGKKYWRVGYRTVSWKAEDPNKDPLLFDVELERADDFTFPVRRDLEATQLGVDVTAVPDGRYRFRITASDRVRNPAAPLETTGLSRWFTVDTTPPEVTVRRDGGTWLVEARDAGSSIARAEWSRDGERWTGMAPEDGILDGGVERFRIPVAAGRHVLVVRVVDRHHNRATAGAVEEQAP